MRDNFGFPGQGIPAASGYVRFSPNLCRINQSYASLLTPLVQNTLTLVTGPVGCKGLILLLENYAKSNNSVLSRFSSTQVYNSSSGNIPIAENYATSYEQVATPVANVLLGVTTEVHVPTNSIGQVWLRLSGDAGNQFSGNYAIVGYYD